MPKGEFVNRARAIGVTGDTLGELEAASVLLAKVAKLKPWEFCYFESFL